MSFSVLLGKMLIFVVLMMIGYACARTGYIGKAFVSDASKLAVNVFLVASILNSVFASEMQLDLAELVKIIGVMTLLYAVSALISFAVAKLGKFSPDREPVFEIVTSTGNNMFMGLPVAQQVYGSLGAFYISMSSLPGNLLIYSYYVYRLAKGSGNNKFSIKDVFTPPLVATIISIVIFVADIPIPSAVNNVISSTAAATMPVSMIVVGASLADINFLDAFKDKDVYISAVFRLFIIPAAVYLVLSFIPMDPTLLKSTVLIAACPTAIVCAVLSLQYGREYVFASKTILVTTIFSMVTIPLWIYFLG
jgi:malate permease and related proteins